MRNCGQSLLSVTWTALSRETRMTAMSLAWNMYGTCGSKQTIELDLANGMTDCSHLIVGSIWNLFTLPIDKRSNRVQSNEVRRLAYTVSREKSHDGPLPAPIREEVQYLDSRRQSVQTPYLLLCLRVERRPGMTDVALERQYEHGARPQYPRPFRPEQPIELVGHDVKAHIARPHVDPNALSRQQGDRLLRPHPHSFRPPQGDDGRIQLSRIDAVHRRALRLGQQILGPSTGGRAAVERDGPLQSA
mmetsp:Transcript_17206/g.49835  ORF Transcript_17206/g.49835 Transcript_17206/m.49835 type:complete len:246 (-) Transcript_17206:141-878(-)